MDLHTLLERVGVQPKQPLKANPHISGVCALQPGDAQGLAWCGSPRYKVAAGKSRAAAILVPQNWAVDWPNAVFVSDPQAAFAAVAAEFAQDQRPAEGIHPSACIHPTAQLGEDVRIGPGVVVEADARLGDGVALGAHCYIGAGVSIGERSELYPRVSVHSRAQIGPHALILSGAVIGSRGFGNYHDGQAWRPIPQLGSVQIGSHVEIGANTTIDCGALEDTIIGDNVRIDNQCQIAHNVQIGAQTAIAAQVGIAGSTRIGQGCMIGGQAGISGHIDIADRVILNGGAVVLQSITEPGQYGSGTPLLPVGAFRRLLVLLRRLEPRLKALEKAVQRG